MVSSKSTTFVFCLVFISTSLNSSLAYTNQVTRKVVVEDENGFTMTSGSSLRHMEHKEILNGGDDEAGKGKMEGRKMMVERKDMMSKGKKKEEGGKSLTTSATTTSSNGNCSEYSCTVGNYSHKGQGKMMRMQRKLRIIRSTDSIKDNPGGFMAFNADYHMARPHPPKNN
nr:Root meristem growth factor 3 like [Ipomoea batatas]